jgi:hypothetical protein
MRVYSSVPVCVADPGCLSWILIFTHSRSQISDPGSWIPDPRSQILDPKTATKERGGKKIFCIFFVAINFTKFKNYFIFEMQQKKMWANF